MKKRMKNLLKWLRNNDYKTVNLLDYLHHKSYYKLIGVGQDKTFIKTD